MKRKLVARNKAKMTERLKRKIYYAITRDISWSLRKRNTNYTKTLDFENAYRRTPRSTIILVPNVYSSTVKRSRIKNVVVSYLVLTIEEFNNKFDLNKQLVDIPSKV